MTWIAGSVLVLGVGLAVGFTWYERTRPTSRMLALVATLAAQGTAVLLATHDAELAVAVASRTVLLGKGEVVADAPTADVLGGGWYFATQTARVLGGAALDPEAGAALLRARLDHAVHEEVVR